ncbi:MAG: exodeoxyribonuclease V subunit beta [Desulfocapsa sp.]|nr:exodeoxyribonuclease V subunit beta [Desulfocapsa sp.]
MSENFQPFDAATASLHRGVNVVEASAGTGKTYSIAMLVLRFVAEFGVPVEELLVVSYTRAATEELRARIRKRLVEAREILGNSEEEGDDSGLVQWLNRLPDRALALERLELALLDMDRAAVFTIHGFCQRMLQEQALESGQLFDLELTTDTSRVRDELVEDYWRSRFYDMLPFHCSLFLGSFSNPDELYESIRGVGAEDVLEPAGWPSVDLALEQVDNSLETLVTWWQQSAPALAEFFREAIAQGMFKKGFAENFDSWWQQCASFFSGVSRCLPTDLASLGYHGLKEQLHGNKLRGDAKKNAFLEDWPLADEGLDRFLDACQGAVLGLRLELARNLQTGLHERLNKQGRFSFDDLVLQLAKALGGEHREELRKLLAGRFQVALIDEFQDTDAAQYRIFSTLFGDGKHFLFLIGDPKQAIYKFRGADIYAYFQARRSASQLLGLEKNYRSSPLLVHAVNALFLENGQAFVTPDLPYHKVSAAKSSECWRLWQDGTSRAAMVCCSLASPTDDGIKPWTSGVLQERLQSYVVNEIRTLLQQATLVTDRGEKRRVSAGDVAILVRTNRQAEDFQQALALAAVPSVISSRKSVFETGECTDLFQVITAVASPGDIRLLRTAMSCKWFGMNGRRLYEQTRDERAVDAWIERFHGYHQLWQDKGFLVMINCLFAQESVFETLCHHPLAERQIVNLSHLVELVQEAENDENMGISHTLQYLSSQMGAGERPEHAELRLESDEQAVKVVTMHAVKGLEYPIVFCPYLWYRSARLGKEKDCIISHDEQGCQVADLGSGDFSARRDMALQDELAEEVRLLYVALTRASCRSYVFWADVRGNRFTASSKGSALSWILSLAEEEGIDGQAERIAALCDGEAAEFRLLPAHPEEREWHGGESKDAGIMNCRTFSRSIVAGEWLMTSYSALAGQTHFVHGPDPAGSAEKERTKSRRIYDLPFGAGFGNVVHGLLEDYPFSLLAGDEGYEEEILGQCRRFGVRADVDLLMGLLRDVSRSPLSPGNGEESFSLLDLAERDLLKEMPFYFHLREESTVRINELLAFSDVVQPIQEQKLRGYLTGFVDLVCRYRGRYYIVDYKSNYLGDSFSEYGQDELVAAMREHNYGLQYWIYTLVLHRFLAGTLPTYSYDQDFGGVFYLFARGMSPEYPGNGVFYDRPDHGVLEELQKSLGAD